jgi:hypothetical protein
VPALAALVQSVRFVCPNQGVLMSDREEAVRRLEERVALLEDQVELYQLISSYGPAVDSGSGDVTAGIWTEDGTYDTIPEPLNGREDLRAMVAGDGHQSLIQNGCAHVMALPHLVVEGDTAVATGYSRVYLSDGDGFRVWRASSNRWEFVRRPEGWRAVSRVNRALDGSPEARQILREGIAHRPT